MLRNRAAAEDAIADETFGTAWEKMKTFDTTGRGIWFCLHAIAKNTGHTEVEVGRYESAAL